MQELVGFFNQGWVGSLLGLIGIVLGAVGIFSCKISRSSPKPSFQKFSLPLIGREEANLPPDVTVSFKGKVVERLTKTTLIMWNDGTEVLEGKDIVRDDPITIGFINGDNILSFNVLKRTKDVNNFSLTKIEGHPHQLRVNFDYLDPQDGIVLEILHDSKERYPIIKGTVKGLPKGFVDLGTVLINRQSKGSSKIFRPKLLYLAAFITGLVMVILGLIFGFLPSELKVFVINTFNSANHVPYSNIPWLLILLGLLYASMPGYILWSKRRKYPAQLEHEEVEL